MKRGPYKGFCSLFIVLLIVGSASFVIMVNTGVVSKAYRGPKEVYSGIDSRKPDKPGKPNGGTPNKPDEPQPDPSVDKWAVVVGISDYRGRSNDLQYCDDDARDWKNFLTSQGYQVKTLIDRKATNRKIEAEIDNLLALEDGNDYIVFTYSGHGTSAGGSSIIPYDEIYMSSGFLDSKFNNADSQHIYFTFDACQIGGMQKLVETGRVGAFASNSQHSYDGSSSMRNGVFTYYQMEGWNIYNNFEENGNYAVTNMENWASNYGIIVDPFVKDMYDGSMTP